MCVATSTIVAAGIAGASSIAGAKMASNASKNAAKTQVASADKAIGLQQQQYQQARQDFNPYQQAGAQAIGNLQQRAGAAPPVFTPGQSFSLGNPQGSPQGAPPPPGMGQPQGGPQAPPMSDTQQRPPMSPQGGPQGQMVLMRAPDGSMQRVPQHMVQMALQKGAQVVQQ